MNEEIVLQYLKISCYGKEKHKSSANVEHDLMTSGNELRKKIHNLRKKGEPIASCDSGYFYAKNAAEIYSTIRQLQKMRNGLDEAIAGLEKGMRRFGEKSGDT